jgi:hypothetical protein
MLLENPTEPEQLLSIINRIQIENKPVFFTEGHTDPIILLKNLIKVEESLLYSNQIQIKPILPGM